MVARDTVGRASVGQRSTLHSREWSLWLGRDALCVRQPHSIAGMTRAMPPGPAVERLAHDLFDRGPGDPLTEELAGWFAGSVRFRAFADAHRDKIRKKLRTAASAEALRDVRVELRVARLLLADRRVELAFEAYCSGRVGRGFEGTRGFYERYLRLGAVLVWCEAAAGAARVGLWINRSARIAVPERAARACLQCLLGSQ